MMLCPCVCVSQAHSTFFWWFRGCYHHHHQHHQPNKNDNMIYIDRSTELWMVVVKELGPEKKCPLSFIIHSFSGIASFFPHYFPEKTRKRTVHFEIWNFFFNCNTQKTSLIIIIIIVLEFIDQKKGRCFFSVCW